MSAPIDLPATWRERAAELEVYAPPAAEAWRRAAVELAEALRVGADEIVTLGSAAAESGYSERRLRELVVEGKLANVGRKHAPRFRRGDLPRKSARPANGAYDASADARRVLTGVRP